MNKVPLRPFRSLQPDAIPLEVVRLEERVKGHAILFESSLLLEESDKQLLDHVSFFHTINGLSSLNLSGADAIWFQNLFGQLEQEYEQQQFARPFAMPCPLLA